MSSFQRDSLKWLRRLFPSNSATITPHVRSDDVQLVQTFDGGGYMPHGFDPTRWFIINFVVANPGPGARIEIWNRSILSPGDEFRESTVRLLSPSIRNDTAPGAAADYMIELEHPNQAEYYPVSGIFTLPNATGTASTILLNLPVIFGPRQDVYLIQTTGPAAANHNIRFRCFGCTTPLTGSFTI